MKIIFLVFCLSIFFILYYYIFRNRNQYTNFNSSELYKSLLDKHYKYIFPNNANRNSGGFRFFEYIYDNLATSEELFDVYNTFYCAVSGSIVSPDRGDNFSIVKVNDIKGNCIFGKYYRCCTPCNCDIMKYTTVIKTNIEMPKGSKRFIQRNLLTIGDPCERGEQDQLPQELDKNIFKCSGNVLNYGYRVDSKNNITKGKGRLIIGVLYDIEDKEKKHVENTLSICKTGSKRLYSSPDELKYGMGDIFVKLALINNDKIYKNNDTDLCKI
jgi:hypothetical protein